MYHFFMLPRAEQEQTIRRLAASGMSPDTISAATGLSREQIQLVLSPTNSQEG
jgi:hypothetical protein